MHVKFAFKNLTKEFVKLRTQNQTKKRKGNILNKGD